MRLVKDEHGFDRALCDQCGKMIPQVKKSNSRFCSDVCRQRAYRRRAVGAPETMPREYSTGAGSLKNYQHNLKRERRRSRSTAQSVT